MTAYAGHTQEILEIINATLQPRTRDGVTPKPTTPAAHAAADSLAHEEMDEMDDEPPSPPHVEEEAAAAAPADESPKPNDDDGDSMEVDQPAVVTMTASGRIDAASTDVSALPGVQALHADTNDISSLPK